MSTIKDMKKKFKTKAVVESENQTLKRKVEELESKLARAKAKTNVIKIHISPEEVILDQQILRLHKVSTERTLTLDETRMLDIHIKNKRLLNEKSTINADYTKIPDGYTEQDLLEIAKGEKTAIESASTKDTVE